VNPACSSWIAIFSALLTPVIALSVAFIAYRQWRTAQNRLKLDLFDRCLAIHTAAVEIISNIITNQFDSGDLTKFSSTVRQARWLLDEEAALYFQKVFIPKIVDYSVLSLRFIDDEEQERHELFRWIADQEDILDAKFDRFLKIKP
jgi:hypothetical protein